MHRFAVVLRALRYLMLAASLGSLLGAVMMFLVGFDHLLHTAVLFFDRDLSGEEFYRRITVDVLESVDAFLFGSVFVLFSYAIALGFVFQLPASDMENMPRWMRNQSLGELKQSLVEVVIVGLIVIFAGIAVQLGRDLEWDDLVLPIAILLLSGGLRLIREPAHPALPVHVSGHPPEHLAPLPPHGGAGRPDAKP
jgi:uncharacterized membrane protein YqhA